MTLMLAVKVCLLGLFLSHSYAQYALNTLLCTSVNENCNKNEEFCSRLTRCKSNCQTIDTIAYACPDKCRKCAEKEACKDAEFWCTFLGSSPLCNKYDIGIKICPKSCGKCNDCKFIRRNNGCNLVNGNWGSWSAWSSCRFNRQTRRRSCNNPSPSRCGKSCIGLSYQKRSCLFPGCVPKCPKRCPNCYNGRCYGGIGIPGPTYDPTFLEHFPTVVPRKEPSITTISDIQRCYFYPTPQ